LVPCPDLVLFASTTVCCARRPTTLYRAAREPLPRVSKAVEGSKCVRRELTRRKHQVRARYQIRANALLCWRWLRWVPSTSGPIFLVISLYKILFHVNALLWESIILLLAPPSCKAYPIAIQLHDHRAIYAPPPTPPLYAVHHTLSVMAILCKGQFLCPIESLVGCVS